MLPRRGLVYLAVTFVITCVFSIARDFRSSGFASPTVEGIPVWCALLWIIGVLFYELVWNMRTVSSGTGIVVNALMKAVLWPAICVIAVVPTFIFATMVLPDASAVYFKLNKDYVQSHWQIDAVSKLAYFPVIFGSAAPLGMTTIPERFYVLDEHDIISFDRMMNRFTVRGCDEYTTVRHVEDHVYFVELGSEPEGRYLKPCLINPIPKKAG
jgi:hypothetical protein